MLNVLIFPRHWEKMEYSWEGIGMQCDFHNYFRKSEGKVHAIGRRESMN